MPGNSTKKRSNPISSLFISSKLFSDSESIMSPTSILETINRPSNRKTFLGHEQSSTAIGLGLVDSLAKDNFEKRTLSQNRRMVLFGSQLKIQIPNSKPNSCSTIGSFESPRTPIEFGIKNKNSQLALHSPAASIQASPPRVFTGFVSPREMELSEDYTCVISYGPNPKKTHIFDNCIVENCGEGFVALRKEEDDLLDGKGSWCCS